MNAVFKFFLLLVGMFLTAWGINIMVEGSEDYSFARAIGILFFIFGTIFIIIGYDKKF